MSLDPSFLEWLMAARTPSIRYKTLTLLMDCPGDEARQVGEQEVIQSQDPVSAVLSDQGVGGWWSHEKSYYTPKYTSTHWSMLLLHELGAAGKNPSYQAGARHMLTASSGELQKVMARKKTDLACYYGNLLRYALPAVNSEDQAVVDLECFLTNSLLDGSCRCEYNDGLACAWGVVRSLWGLAGIRPAHRSQDWDEAVQSGVRFLLEQNSLVKADYPQPALGKIHPLWSRMSFPLFYQADILFTLRVLCELGAARHPGAAPALDWIEQRRAANGRWHGSHPFRRRTWAALSDQEETNRWVSLQAAWVLKQAGNL